MANQIALFKEYVPILDEVYKEASKTAVLDGAPELARAGANANELIIPKLDMQGLGDYNRNSGYVDGDVTLTNQTVTCNFDRGRMFTVDALDDAETAGIAFGRLAGEFIRTKVAPEVDAFRFACYAAAPGISTTTGATLSDGAGVVAALRAAATKMDEDEVPMEGRLLFITPTLLGLVQDMDTTKSREVLARFESVTTVPQTRFYTAIEQLSGKPAAREEGQDGRRLPQSGGRQGHQLPGHPPRRAHPVHQASGSQGHPARTEPECGCVEVRLPHGRHRRRL